MVSFTSPTLGKARSVKRCYIRLKTATTNEFVIDYHSREPTKMNISTLPAIQNNVQEDTMHKTTEETVESFQL